MSAPCGPLLALRIFFLVYQLMENESKRIDGKAVAQEFRDQLKAQASGLTKRPGLAVVLVGARKDSQTYVNMKKKAIAEVGFHSEDYSFPEDVSQAELLATIAELNGKPEIHGILVQLPLPAHISEFEVIAAIKPEKDVDGFTRENTADLVLRGRQPASYPCTPLGIIKLLEHIDFDFVGQHAVVLGRSNIVGMPIANMLIERNCTVTVCHSRTRNLPDICRQADLLVAAIGQPEFVQGDWLKPGVVVMDVGINAVDDDSKKAGYRLVGDVHFASALEKASRITPVPGGVGPMTIAMLLQNTFDLSL